MPGPTPQQQISAMLVGHWTARAVYVAAKLGLADLLASGPRTAADLAEATGTHRRSLYRLLRALASVGVFQEGPEQRFSLTPSAECLRTDAPGSLYPMVLLMGEEEHYAAWARLLDCVRTGRTGFELTFGEPLFDYLSKKPEQARLFDAAMTSIHGRETAAMLDAYDVSGFETVADLGGGNGSTLCGILARHPRMRGVLFDLPGVIERARASVASADCADRLEFVAGSFFEAIPEGADAYLLRHIIHDWDDDQSEAILRNVRKVMRPQTRVLVVESVIEPGNEPSFGKLLDLNMLVMPGGVERTEPEYQELFERAGLRLNRVVPTDAGVSVIEAVPA
jgi:hypothetical protein